MSWSAKNASAAHRLSPERVRALLLLACFAADCCRASALDVLNSLRSRPCAKLSASAPLKPNFALDAAARAMQRGASLHAALARAGFEASEVSVIHFEGDERTFGAALRSKYCAVVANPHLDQVGIAAARASGSGATWVVLAAQFIPPSVGRAAQVEADVLSLSNRARREGHRCGATWFPAASALVADPQLARAALIHANDMAAHDFLEHRGSDGSAPSDRVRRAGFGAAGAIGENIAGGAESAAEAVQGWLSSAGHCANLMDSRFQRMGAAFAVNSRSHYRIYWVQNFAAQPQASHASGARAKN